MSNTINLSRTELVRFLEQMATMLRAGLTLPDALDALNESPSLGQAELAKALYKDVHSGYRLSAAFAKYEDVFDPVFIGTVRMAEDSGTLMEAFRNLTDQMTEQDKHRQELLKSMTYPLVQLVVTILMVMFLLYYMLPRFMPFFTASGQELPYLTQLVVNLSESWPVRYSPAIGLVFLVLAIRAWKNRKFRTKLVRLSYYLPGIGPLIYRQSLASCCEQLAVQLETGLLLDFALNSVSRCTPFPPLSRMFLRLRKGVREGESFQDLVEQEALIPPIMAICLAVGDETGRMVPMIRLASGIIKEQVEVKRDAFLQLVEPLLLMIMGLSVGILVLACFLPIYHLAMANL